MVRRTIQAYDTAIVASCPKCKVNLKLFRSSIPQIDSSGFESYSFHCEACKSSLAGIIDPLDEELLVSLSEPASWLEYPSQQGVNCQTDTLIGCAEKSVLVILAPKRRS
jgi:hypothetical protein